MSVVEKLRGLFTVNALIALGLAAAMLFTGTVNTVVTKFQDLQRVKGIGKSPPMQFEHPFTQTLNMFLGELCCLFVFGISLIFNRFKPQKESIQEVESLEEIVENRKKPGKKANPLIFIITASCDLVGSTLLNLGLIFTYASVYQMLRGSIVVFTTLLATIFLKSKYYFHHWFGVFLNVAGLSIVGYASVVSSGDSTHVARAPFFGAILVIAAEIIAAAQFVLQESFLSKYEVGALECVGWEGFWGTNFTIIILFILYFIPGSDHHSVENAVYAMAQAIVSPILLLSLIAATLSIAFFNFFGIKITQRISSSTRATIDACRTALVWVFSLAVGWEDFSWIQLIGFIILIVGTFLFNEVITIPVYHKYYLQWKEEYQNSKK